jgi:ferrous-iron efflux pump FieF
VALALFLVLIHAPVYWYTGSLTVFSSMVESAADLCASIVAFVALHLSNKPADRDHRFGHGKAEPLGTLILCGFMGFASLLILKDSVQRWFNPVAVEHTQAVYVLAAVAVAFTLLLVLFQRWVLRRVNSSIIEADHLHYKGDLLLYVSMIVSAVASTYGHHWVDSVASAAIALLVLFQMWPAARRSYHVLMDGELDDSQRESIKQRVRSHPLGSGAHRFMTRESGSQVFIQFHLELPGHLTLSAAHDQAHTVVDHLLTEWPNAEVLVHIEPIGAGPHYGG